MSLWRTPLQLGRNTRPWAKPTPSQHVITSGEERELSKVGEGKEGKGKG